MGIGDRLSGVFFKVRSQHVAATADASASYEPQGASGELFARASQ